MYSTPPSLTGLMPEDELLQLADDSGVGDLSDPAVQAVLTEAIDQADRDIDGYVGTIQTVPLTDVPGLVANISAKLAVHYLFLRRPGVAEPETWENEASRCYRLLESIAKGTIVIGPREGESVEPESEDILVAAPGRIFTQERWREF
jgi:phage gp36-like protein